MQANIIAFTKEGQELDFEQAKLLCGKNAGICYMKGTEFMGNVTDTEKALNRFDKTVKNRHHSIADHMRVEVYFKDISKMLAIVLNSLQDYATSEKSGRFTEMVTNDPDEARLYDKWREIFKNEILDYRPDLTEEAAGKLAQENARYMLSVFTKSTSIGYSTSIRQWNYIIDWCQKYMNGVESNPNPSGFEQKLYTEIKELHTFLMHNLYIENLRDTKNRYFEFLGALSGNPNHPLKNYDFGNYEVLNTVYQVTYTSSFVQIAQAQRHRTLKYFITYLPKKKDDMVFFVPPLIETKENLRDEWLNDLTSIADHYPQATLINIMETGHISDFILKCGERLCGRAQWETMNQTRITAQCMLQAAEKSTNPLFHAYADILRGTHEGLKTKKELSDMCVEPCIWGCDKCFNRQV